MDRRQRKAKKREDKLKKHKLHQEKLKNEGISDKDKKSGNLQLFIFFGVAIIGAIVIIFNV